MSKPVTTQEVIDLSNLMESEMSNSSVDLSGRRRLIIALALKNYAEKLAKNADPMTEDPDVTMARARRSFAIALARVDVSDDDRAVLVRMALPAWQAWVAAMQEERKRGTDGYRIHAAALMVCVNVLWESICMTMKTDLWVPASERMLKRLADAVREGPQR